MMLPSKPKRSESRRSSILKPCKPRQPLQNVNFDSSSNESSPTTSKVRRRVSFAEKKHVKEFCHSTEQGTVWDNTYEEHDFSLKGSLAVDQNAQINSEENMWLCTSNNDFIHSELNSCCLNNACLVNNQLLQESVARANGENNDANCDLDFAALPSKSFVSKDIVSNDIAYSDLDKECMELPDEAFQSKQIVITNTSKGVESSNIIIYRDSDEEDYIDNVANKHSEVRSDDINSDLDKKHIQDSSMDLTAPVSVLLPSHLHAGEQKEQEHNESMNNLDVNYISNYNVSMEITQTVPIFAKSVPSNLEIPTILQNCENTKLNTANICNTMFPTNLQPNVSKDIFEYTPDVKYANDSMVLTSVMHPFTDVTSTDTRRTNNTVFDPSMEMIVPLKMDGKKENNENTVRRNDLRTDQTDKTEIFNSVLMEMTKPVGTILLSHVYDKENFKVDEPSSKDDRSIFFHNVSMEMTKTLSTKSKHITDVSTDKSFENDTHSEKDVNVSNCFNDGTRILCKSMKFTEALPAPLYHERIFHAEHIAHSNKSTCENYKNDRTEFFNDASMELTKSVNIAPLNIMKENLKINESVSKDDKIPAPLYHEKIFHAERIAHPNKGTCENHKNDRTEFFNDASMELTKSVNIAPLNIMKENLKINESVSKDDKISARLYHEKIFHAEHIAHPNKGTCENHKNDRTEFFNDASMELTKSVNIAPLNIMKENLKINESVSKDDKISARLYHEKIFHAEHIAHPNKGTCENHKNDRTEFFNDASMELTKSVNIAPLNIMKENLKINESVSKDDKISARLYHEKIFHAEHIAHPNKGTCENHKNDRTEFFNDASMELTKSVNIAPLNIRKENLKINESVSKDDKIPAPLYHEKIFHAEHIAHLNENTCENHKNDRTEFFNDASMELTKSVNIAPLNTRKENLKINESVSKDDKIPAPLYHEKIFHAEHIAHPNKGTCENHKNDRTEFFNDASMELTKSVNIAPLNTRKENLKINESVSKDDKIPAPLYHEKIFHAEHIAHLNENTCENHKNDRTEFFNDASMELTKSVNIAPLNTRKENLKINESVSKDDKIPAPLYHEKIFHAEHIAHPNKGTCENHKNDRTEFFNDASMELTKSVNIAPLNTRKENLKINESVSKDDKIPAPLYHEKIFHAEHIAHLNENTCENHKNDKIEFFNDASMELTKPNVAPLNIGKENSKINESVSENDKTIFFHNVSMEMTTAISLKVQKEITQPIICKSISKENTRGEKDTNNSTCFNEGTNILCKSMEFAEVVPISSHDEKTFNTHTTQSALFSQTLSKTISLPAGNSARIAFQTEAVANETIQDTSIEITAALPSILHLTQDVKENKTEDLIISKNDEHLIINNNLTESRKNIIKENFTISREIMETENIRHDELSNVFVSQSPLDNLDHSSNTNLENVSKKRTFDEDEKSYLKKIRSSFMEAQSSQENDMKVHSLPSTSANYVNDVNDIMDRTQAFDSNLRDNLNETSEHSFLTKSLPYLENSLELQSIKPPSFLCLDSEEENSFHKIQHEFQSPTITDIPVNNTSNRSVINKVTESTCIINSRENAVNDYFTILREKEEPINAKNNQAQDSHKSTIIDKTEVKQETDCKAITKTIINDNQLNTSNYTTKTINEERILSMNTKDGKTVTVQATNHCTSLVIEDIEIIDKDQVDERKCIQKRTHEDASLQNNVKEEGQYLNKKKRETEKCSDHFKGVVIEDQIDPEEHRKSLNEVKQQGTKQKDERATEGFVMAQYVNTIEDVQNNLTKQDPFLILLQKLEAHAREDCIWNIYYKNINKKMIVFGFISNSLLIATSYDFNGFNENNLIKGIKIISRISDDTGVFIKIVHKLILETVNVEILTNLYKTHQDILPMLNFISQDVKVAMDFMFDLRRLDDLNLMEIAHDEISFISRSKRMDIILKVTIKIKRFDKLTSNDINLSCLLGRIKETDVKNLIKNVKRDHKFLRRYMNDVKDYIDIMEGFQINLMTESEKVYD